MLAINSSQTHAIISFVASGHVVFLDAESRLPVDCIRTPVGAGGARQVHFAIPAPDESYVAVANQNGKLFERINTDYAANSFHLDVGAGIDLANCTTIPTTNLMPSAGSHLRMGVSNASRESAPRTRPGCARPNERCVACDPGGLRFRPQAVAARTPALLRGGCVTAGLSR